MSRVSCVSHDDSTSICAADAPLDMSTTRYGAKALDMPCGARRKKAQSTLVAIGNISNANIVSIYRLLATRANIELRSNISTYRRYLYRVRHRRTYRQNKGVNQMTDNKNQLREDAIEFAIQISDLCDEIKGCSVYVNQIVRSSSSIGANIHEAKYAQSKADFINKLEISLKECSETEYWLELIFRKGKMSETTYKDLRNKCGSIRRRLIASITTAKENA